MTTTTATCSLALDRVLDRINIQAVGGTALLKDVVLLGAALWTLGESLARRRS
jgi:hypothetical protein